MLTVAHAACIYFVVRDISNNDTSGKIGTVKHVSLIDQVEACLGTVQIEAS